MEYGTLGFNWADEQMADISKRYASNPGNQNDVGGMVAGIPLAMAFGQMLTDNVADKFDGSFFGNGKNFGNNKSDGNNNEASSNGIFCSECGINLSPDDLFCPKCGNKIINDLTCSNCGKILYPDAKFCSKCGTPVNK